MYGFHYRQIALIRSYYLPNIVEGIANARVSSTTSSVGSDDLGRISCHQMLSNGTHYIDQRHWGATSILLFLYKVTREGVFNHTNLLVRSCDHFNLQKYSYQNVNFYSPISSASKQQQMDLLGSFNLRLLVHQCTTSLGRILQKMYLYLMYQRFQDKAFISKIN